MKNLSLNISKIAYNAKKMNTPGKQSQISNIPPHHQNHSAFDTKGPFTKSNSGNRYALTTQCDLSHYVIIEAISDKSTESIAKAFIENCILIYGIPSVNRTDQRTEYKNEILYKINEFVLIYPQIFNSMYIIPRLLEVLRGITVV